MIRTFSAALALMATTLAPTPAHPAALAPPGGAESPPLLCGIPAGGLEPRALDGGRRAFVDPETGALVEPPAAALRATGVSAEVAAAMSTSGEGLMEFHLPDGAVGIRLEGRFRSALFATATADGAIVVTHAVAEPPVPAVEVMP